MKYLKLLIFFLSSSKFLYSTRGLAVPPIDGQLGSGLFKRNGRKQIFTSSSDFVFQLYHRASTLTTSTASLRAVSFASSIPSSFFLKQHLTLNTYIKAASTCISDAEMINLCWALGVLGIRGVALERLQAWDALDQRIARIDFGGIDASMREYNQQRLLSLGHTKELPMSPVIKLLTGLSAMEIRWVKLSRESQYVLTYAIQKELQNIGKESSWRYQRMTTSPLLFLLGNMKVTIAELPASVRDLFNDRVVDLLDDPSPSFSLANTIYSISKLKMSVVQAVGKEVDSSISQSSQLALHDAVSNAISKHKHTVRRSSYWKLLSGISSLGMKYRSLYGATREAIELPLQKYEDTSFDDRIFLKEVSSILSSFASMGANWSDFSASTKEAILLIIQRCLSTENDDPSFSSHDFALVISGLGRINCKYDQLVQPIHKDVERLLEIALPRLQSWDLSILVLGLGQINAPDRILAASGSLESVIISSSRFFGPTAFPKLLHGISLLCKENADLSSLQSTLVASVDKWISRTDLVGISYIISALTLFTNKKVFFSHNQEGYTIDENFIINSNSSFKRDSNNKLYIYKSSKRSLFSQFSGKDLETSLNLLETTRKILTNDSYDVLSLLKTFHLFGISLSILNHLPGSFNALFKNMIQSRVSYSCEIEEISDVAAILDVLVRTQADSSFILESTHKSLFSLMSKDDLVDNDSMDSILNSLFCLNIRVPGSLTDESLVPLLRRHLKKTTSSDTVLSIVSIVSDLGLRTKRDLIPLVQETCYRIVVDRPTNYDVLSILYVIQHLGLNWSSVQKKLQSKLIGLITLSCSKNESIFGFCMLLLRASDAFSSMSEETLSFINSEIAYMKDKSLDNAALIAESMAPYLNKHSVLTLVHDLLREENAETLSVEHINAVLELVFAPLWSKTWSTIDEVDRNAYKKSFVGAISRLSPIISFDTISLIRKAFNEEYLGISLNTIMSKDREIISKLFARVDELIVPKADSLSEFATENTDKDSALRELANILPTIKPMNIPNTFFFLYKLGCNLHDIKSYGLWDPLLSSLVNSVSVWGTNNEKISMVLNALEKMHVFSRDLPLSFQSEISSIVLCNINEMTPRLVSNVIYYLARMNLFYTKNLKSLATKSFFGTCHLMEPFEFINGLWAVTTYFKVDKMSKLFDEQKFVKTIEIHGDGMNARDLSSLIASLNTLGYSQNNLPDAVKSVIDDSILYVEYGSSSIAYIVFGLGGLNIRFEDLSPVVRVTLREAIQKNCFNCTAKEVFWITIGCSRMQLNLETCSTDFKENLLTTVGKNIGSSELLPESVFYISRALSRMNVKWMDFTPHLRAVLDDTLRSAARSKTKIDTAVLDFFPTMASLELSVHDLSRRTRNAVFTRVCRVHVPAANPTKLLALLQASSRIGLKYLNMPKGLSSAFILNFYTTLISDSSFLISATSAVSELDFDWSILSDDSKARVVESLLKLMKIKHVPVLISAIEQLRVFGAKYSDFSAISSEIPNAFDEVISKSISSSQSNLLRNSFGKRHEDLMKELSLFGYQTLGPEIELNQLLGNLKDTELIRAVFILGQRVQKKKISAHSFLSINALAVLDQRLSVIFQSSLESTEIKTLITPAALESLLSSFRRLEITADQLPKSILGIVSYFTLLSRALDRRTFIAIMRSLVALQVNWAQLSFADKFYLSRGIARSASTSQPSKIALLLKTLASFCIPAEFLYMTIPLVMRYVLYRTFTSVVTYDRSGSGNFVSRGAYIDIIESLAATGTSYRLMGEKASLALLGAADAKLISVDTKLSIRFIRAVAKMYKEAPPRFWRELKPDTKSNFRGIFEKAVWGIETDTTDNEEEIFTDFKDSDAFLALILMMDDEDISNLRLRSS